MAAARGSRSDGFCSGSHSPRTERMHVPVGPGRGFRTDPGSDFEMTRPLDLGDHDGRNAHEEAAVLETPPVLRGMAGRVERSRRARCPRLHAALKAETGAGPSCRRPRFCAGVYGGQGLAAECDGHLLVGGLERLVDERLLGGRQPQVAVGAEALPCGSDAGRPPCARRATPGYALSRSRDDPVGGESGGPKETPRSLSPGVLDDGIQK